MSWSFIIIIAVSVALLGNILLMGLPGAIFLSLASYVVKPLRWKGINELGDKAWPMAIVVTFLWGIGLIPCKLLMEEIDASRPLGVWLLWIGWAFLLSLAFLAYANLSSHDTDSRDHQ